MVGVRFAFEWWSRISDEVRLHWCSHRSPELGVQFRIHIDT